MAMTRPAGALKPVTSQRPGAKKPVQNTPNPAGLNPNWRQNNQNLRGKLKGLSPTDPMYNRITNRINFNRQKAGLKPRTFGGTVAPEVQAPAAPATPQPQLPAQAQPKPDYMGGMFPDVDPRKYMGDYLNTPGYKFRTEQGTKALDRLMSRDGLVSSGAEIQANQDLSARLSSEEYDNALRTAQTMVNNKIGQGDQLQRVLTGEAQRRDDLGQNQTDNLLKLYSMQLGQNPLQYTYQGMLQGADMGYKYGQDKGAANMNAVQRQIPGYSGGGGSSIPAFQAPFPTGPDQSQADASRIWGGASAGGDYLGALGNMLRSFNS